MATAEGHGMGKYVAVYVCLLVITAAQFLIGYQNSQGSQMAVRMLTFAVIETVLVVLFFMNLGSEKNVFVKFVVYLHALRARNHELHLDGQLPAAPVPTYKLRAKLMRGGGQ